MNSDDDGTWEPAWEIECMSIMVLIVFIVALIQGC